VKKLNTIFTTDVTRGNSVTPSTAPATFIDRLLLAHTFEFHRMEIADCITALAADGPTPRSADRTGSPGSAGEDILTAAVLDGAGTWAPLAADASPAARTRVAANCAELAVAASVAPAGGDEVGRTISRLATELGVSRGKALTYCDIGSMLTRLPATADALACGAFGLDLVRILADVTATVGDDHLVAVDADLANALTPTRGRQVVPGPRILRRTVTGIVGAHDPSALPPDPDTDERLPEDPALQLDFTVDTRDAHATTFHVTMTPDEATGTLRIIDAVAAAHHTSRSKAFAELVHGSAGDVSVTLNCYRNLDSGTMHFENTWLSAVATDRWMARVTHLAVPGHSATDGRFVTDNQRALRIGVDGTCRGPACQRDAAVCDTDHIHRVDEDSDSPAPTTTTWATQQLCRACHNAKTRGLFDYTAFPDGSTHVTSLGDGHRVVTRPTGPLADADLTFDSRLQRRTATRAGHQAGLAAHRALTAAAIAGEVPF
jgi:hypothetical protein